MISTGSRVRIKTLNKEGTVIELKDSFAQVTVDNVSPSSPAWYPIDQLEEIEQLVDRFLRNDLDDPLDYILSIDAYRLLTEYRFNPYVLASSTKITIFPHQIDEVFRMIDNPRMMLADEVGLGKTISAALVASELKARGLINRMLFAVPKSIVIKWRDELNDRFELDARIIDSEYARVNGNPFLLTEFCYVASMDYLKQRHVMNMLEQDLDFSLVDEAHKLSLGTDRLELGKYLSTKSNFMLLLSATPHNGNDDDYLIRMNLLDPYVSDITSSACFIYSCIEVVDGKTPREAWFRHRYRSRCEGVAAIRG
jgi:SNF2 family DNA or RNA helicase